MPLRINYYGEFLMGKRIEKGLTFKKLAELSGVAERNLHALETEDGKHFSLHDIRRCCKALEVSMNEVFDD
jgi:DNA-binding Xre family transcriptional regulator